jgi:hypothetical protein
VRTVRHEWSGLGREERDDLSRVVGRRGFDALVDGERATLRALRLALTSERVAGDLWREIREVLWVGPNQAGLIVRDATRFHVLARGARRRDGHPVFRADPRWMLALFKDRAEWSLRETGVAHWGLQLYRRGPRRRDAGEIVADLDRFPLTAGLTAHLRDVRRADGDPAEAWRSLVERLGRSG